jgi:hypothetical protein
VANDTVDAKTQENAGATSNEGTQVEAPGLSDQTKAIIAGLNKDASKKAETIRQVAEALGIDPKDLNADRVKELFAPAKQAEDKNKVSTLERDAALGKTLRDPKYRDIADTLAVLSDQGVTVTKELAETLLASAAPTSSGPRSTGGGSGKTTPTQSDDEIYLRSHNIHGEKIA